MFYAHAVNVRTETDTKMPFDTAEEAARNIAMLLRRDGWSEDRIATIERLVSGETLTHKRFAYRVTQDG